LKRGVSTSIPWSKAAHASLKDRVTYGNPLDFPWLRHEPVIEFEFESRNFWEHGHAVSGCDVIVCWRHNWDECPQNIEIVELCSIIESLGDRQN
jgi:hypothetical protein